VAPIIVKTRPINNVIELNRVFMVCLLSLIVRR
jgi:hypothetical protein